VLMVLMSVTCAWAGNAGCEKAKVIIGYVDKPNQADENMIRAHGGKTKYTYHIINAKAVELPERAIDRIRRNPMPHIQPPLASFQPPGLATHSEFPPIIGAINQD